ncbi:MAG: acetoacetate--CoA ligase, partial [Mesorhizobium sp.]
MADDAPLWIPTQEQIDAAPMTAFMNAAASMADKAFSSYTDLHHWSIEDRETFWSLVWDFCGIVGDKGERVLVDGDKMPGATFFPDAKLNFAENLLKKTGLGDAIVFRGEDKVERRLSWNELHALTSRLQQLFLSLKVKKG